MEREEQMLIQSLKDDEQTILQQISEREASLAKLRGLASTSTSSPSTQAHRAAPTPSLIGIDRLFAKRSVVSAAFFIFIYLNLSASAGTLHINLIIIK